MTRRPVLIAAVLLALAAGPAACAAAPCDAVVTFETGRIPAIEIFVSPTGSNQMGDGSRDDPFRTLAHAAGLATPGTAIRLLPGDHDPGTFLVDLDGTPTHPIWVGGAPGEPRPRIVGGTEGLHLTRCDYLVIHDLEVTGAAANGINCDDGGRVDDPTATTNVVFRDLSIHDIGSGGNQDGLKLSGLHDFVVLRCRIERTGGGTSGSLIDMVGCHRGVIAACELARASGSGIQCKGGSADVLIWRNRFVDAGARGINIGGSTGFQFFRPPLSTDEPNAEAWRIRVHHNLFAGGTCAVAFVGARDCFVSHNTLVDPDTWLFRILQETTSTPEFEFLPSGDNAFSSNLVWYERGVVSTAVNVGPDTAPGTFGFAGNLWYAWDDPPRSRPSLPAPETGGLAGVDPLLAGVGSLDVSLLAGSPAIGAGGAPPPVGTDLTGDCLRDPTSIGAEEGDPALRCVGDLDGDGDTDVFDFAALADAFAQIVGDPYAGADLTGDRVVDVLDFAALAVDFGCVAD
jgi:hypothetical protein